MGIQLLTPVWVFTTLTYMGIHPLTSMVSHHVPPLNMYAYIPLKIKEHTTPYKLLSYQPTYSNTTDLFYQVF